MITITTSTAALLHGDRGCENFSTLKILHWSFKNSRELRLMDFLCVYALREVMMDILNVKILIVIF
jgi:hypothetical protein